MLKIDYDLYIDKVYGAWIGKCAGGKIGAKQENNKEQMNYTFDNVFFSPERRFRFADNVSAARFATKRVQFHRG